MSRRASHGWGLLAGGLLSVLLLGAPARAQDPPDAAPPGPPSTTTTEPGATTSAPGTSASTTSSTQVPDTGDSTTTTTGSTSTSTTSTPDEDIPEPDTGAAIESDPLFQLLDSLGEDYDGQLPFDPASQAVVAVQLEPARAALASAEAAHGLAALRLAELEEQQASLQVLVDELADGDRAWLAEAAAARRRFEARAVDAYVRGRDAELTVVFASEDANEALTRSELLEAVLEGERATVGDYLDRRSSGGDELTGLHDDLTAVERELVAARRAEEEAEVALTDARVAVAVWEAGSQVIAQGFVFPVFGPVSFGDSWGAPRMVGTSQEHWHEGTDVMAAAGTPLVAVEDGVIVRARPNGLGGLGITMRGQSGLQYYYAHLSAYAEGLHGGQSVRAGEILGYVGDTGNAKGGSPHLHFEIARNGKPVNPFPILRVTWEWQMPHILEAAVAIEAADGP